MTIKTYKSSSVISFSITLRAGNYKRIRFTPFSWGGGVYVTSDRTIQEILESRREFGTSYRLVEERKLVPPSPIGSFDDDIAIKEAARQDVSEEARELKRVPVADYAEAKEYLMEQCGYKSAQLRSQKAISDAAEKNGIEFEYN